MDRDSSKDSIREMEQIRRGLEEFLDQEVLHQEAAKGQKIERVTAKEATAKEAVVKEATIKVTAEGKTENEGLIKEELARDEKIQKDNINQEMTEDMRDRYDSGREPQFFTIGEDEKEERELDIIGTKKKSVGSCRAVNDDYVEDWDSPKYRKHATNVQKDAYRSPNFGTKEQSGRSSQKKSDQQSNRKEDSSKRMKNKDNLMSGDARDRKRENSKKSKSRKKKSKFKRFLVTLAVLAVLLLGGVYFLVGKVYTKMNYGEIESVATEPMKENGVTNILLIGNDSRQNGEDGRSDAMILVSISDKTNKIYMTSLLRDMYVEIPGYKGNRLNAAYSYGGAELLMETIELNLDIEVNRYVLVNFEAFANLVDAVGGVDLELTSEEIEYVNAYLVEYNMLTDRPQGTDNMDPSAGGLVHLNGPQALAYTRNRYIGTDFGRTERQRKVLSAIIKNAPKALISNPKIIFDELLPNLTTNLTRTEMFRLSLRAEKLLTYDIVQNSIPIEGSYSNASIRGMSVLEVDYEANKKFLKENVYGEGLSDKE